MNPTSTTLYNYTLYYGGNKGKYESPYIFPTEESADLDARRVMEGSLDGNTKLYPPKYHYTYGFDFHVSGSKSIDQLTESEAQQAYSIFVYMPGATAHIITQLMDHLSKF